MTDLFDGQIQQLVQRWRQRSHDEGSRRAANVQHVGGQHGDEGVLPDEGVEQSESRVCTPRQGAETREGDMFSS